MYLTLSELRGMVDKMIEMQGEDAPCAAFVSTQHDVFEYNDEGGDKHVYFPTTFTQSVLNQVGDSSYIRFAINEMIGSSIRYNKYIKTYEPEELILEEPTLED